MEDALKTSLNCHAQEKLSYFQQWMFDAPAVISAQKFEEANQLHNVFYKLIKCFVNNYDKYTYLMPLSDDVLDILSHWHNKPYQIGSFRTDFVFDDKGVFRPIEITCRFALNGFFLNAIFDQHALQSRGDIPLAELQFPYEQFVPFFYKKLAGTNKVLLLKEAETRNESKFFVPVLLSAGVVVEERTPSQLNANHDDLDSFLIINELNFSELLSINESAHRALANANLLNDLRTVFLVHDKRFFSVICDKDLQAQALSESEITFLQSVIIPTYGASQSPETWALAKNEKENWILKHRALGKSEAVFAGPVTEQSEWNALFKRDDIHEFVLQQWIPQKTIQGTIDGQTFNDFITGTMLFFDEHNFGFADFRTSSFPVSNVVDHRKCVGVVLNEQSTLGLDNLNNIKVC